MIRTCYPNPMKPITYPIAFVAAYVALVMHQAGAYAIAAGRSHGWHVYDVVS